MWPFERKKSAELEISPELSEKCKAYAAAYACLESATLVHLSPSRRLKLLDIFRNDAEDKNKIPSARAISAFLDLLEACREFNLKLNNGKVVQLNDSKFHSYVTTLKQSKIFNHGERTSAYDTIEKFRYHVAGKVGEEFNLTSSSFRPILSFDLAQANFLSSLQTSLAQIDEGQVKFQILSRTAASFYNSLAEAESARGEDDIKMSRKNQKRAMEAEELIVSSKIGRRVTAECIARGAHAAWDALTDEIGERESSRRMRILISGGVATGLGIGAAITYLPPDQRRSIVERLGGLRRDKKYPSPMPLNKNNVKRNGKNKGIYRERTDNLPIDSIQDAILSTEFEAFEAFTDCFKAFALKNTRISEETEAGSAGYREAINSLRSKISSWNESRREAIIGGMIDSIRKRLTNEEGVVDQAVLDREVSALRRGLSKGGNPELTSRMSVDDDTLGVGILDRLEVVELARLQTAHQDALVFLSERAKLKDFEILVASRLADLIARKIIKPNDRTSYSDQVSFWISEIKKNVDKLAAEKVRDYETAKRDLERQIELLNSRQPVVHEESPSAKPIARSRTLPGRGHTPSPTSSLNASNN